MNVESEHINQYKEQKTRNHATIESFYFYLELESVHHSAVTNALILHHKKMIMLVFSIIVICSYLYSVCLVCRFLKNTNFKGHLSVVVSKHSLCDTESNTSEFKLTLMFKLSSNGKGPSGIKPLWKRRSDTETYPHYLWSQCERHGFIKDFFSKWYCKWSW